MELITKLAVYLSPLTLILTWVLTKRHFQQKDLQLKDKDIESQSSDIISKNIKIYQDMLDDIEARYEAKLIKRDEEIKELETKVEKLIREVRLLKSKK
jgi:hypothetical protein